VLWRWRRLVDRGLTRLLSDKNCDSIKVACYLFSAVFCSHAAG
jgi:hypothetical protein